MGYTGKGILSDITSGHSTKNIETHNRKDIQGLRAIAILTVLFAHANFPFFDGGFVGVDIFFVISGFLITGILIKEYNLRGKISIANFYARRVRRIIPAATVVILATVLMSTLILGRDGSVATYWDAFWSAIFMGNWYMAFVGTDYFSLGTTPSPLQHFWSLAVEEQFYFVWPTLIIIAAWFAGKTANKRFKPTLVSFLAVIIVASLAWSAYQTAVEPNIAYFSTLTRGWELAAGALLAVVANKIILNKNVRTVLLYTGIALILFAVLAFTEQTPFPGYSALLPVVGTLLILISGTNNHAKLNGILTNKYMVWIGSISYALYLWHWPLLILWETKYGEKPNVAITISLILVAVLLAWVSTTFIEDPMRLSRWWKDKTFLSNILGIILVAATAATCIFIAPESINRGKIDFNFKTYDEVLQEVKDATKPNSQVYVQGQTQPSLSLLAEDKSQVYDDGCHIEHLDQNVWTDCIYGDVSSEKNIVLVGDSHASMWLPALNLWGIKNHYKITFFAKSECPSATFTPYANLIKRAYPECTEWREEVFNTIIDMKPAAVIMTSAGKLHGVYSDGTVIENTKDMDLKWIEGYSKSIAKLRQATDNVILLGDIAMLDNDSVSCIKANQSNATSCSSPLNEITQQILYRQQKVADDTHVPYIDTVPMFCFEEVCPAIIDNKVVYMDGTHMTRTYSEHLAGAIGEKLNEYIK